MHWYAPQAELSTTLTRQEQETEAVKEADQAAGASAAQLASRQAQEQVSRGPSLSPPSPR